MLKKLLVGTIVFGVFASTVFAEEQKKEEEVFTKGVISSSVRGRGQESVDAPGISDSPGDVQSVIMGSVSPSKGGGCKATLRNNSKENSYAVNFAVVAEDSKGHQLSRRAFGATIKPGEVIVREVSGCAHDAMLKLVITSGHKLK